MGGKAGIVLQAGTLHAEEKWGAMEEWREGKSTVDHSAPPIAGLPHGLLVLL